MSVQHLSDPAVYLAIIKQLATTAEDVIMVTSSIICMKDMQPNSEVISRLNAIRTGDNAVRCSVAWIFGCFVYVVSTKMVVPYCALHRIHSSPHIHSSDSHLPRMAHIRVSNPSVHP